MSYEITKSKTPLDFTSGEDQVFAGSNPEMADIGNPSGAMYDTVYGVSASNESGYRWHYHENLDTQEEAFEFIRKIKTGQIAIIEDHWIVGDPVYGSRAYQNEGCEMEQVFRETGDQP